MPDEQTADRLENPKALPSPPFSLAATFPPFGSKPPRQLRNDPIPERLTRIPRRLAHRGAMVPEGCTREELMRTKDLHRVPAAMIKNTLGTLWAFRLLGYRPADTLGMNYDQIAEIVARQ